VNVKEYIRSGVIESYVLGIATEAERQEFEQMCATYPEVVEARDSFERSLENELLQDAAPPPAALKEKIWLQIKPQEEEARGAAYLPLEDEAPVRRMNPWKWIAAASLLLLVGAGYWAYTTNEKYQELVARQSATDRQLQESTAQLQTLQQDAELLRKPGMRAVALTGTPDAPQAQTTIFWDTTAANKDVYLLINNLPQPAGDKQYQLWALLNNQPIDLGFIEMDVQQKRLLVKMKNVQNAQAFAITLEQRGRANTATPQGTMYAVGKL
jgi:anti-sigma-K factor RskA